MSHPLIRKLKTIARLSPEDEDAILKLPMELCDEPPDRDIVREGDRPKRSCIIVDGFMCRYRLLESGKRQIMAFHIPGDMPDLISLHLGVMDHTLGTLTPCRLAFVAHEHLHRLCRDRPNLNHALWRDTLISWSVLGAWITGIGRKPALNRVAHLLCEVSTRLEAVGLAEDFVSELPITQTELGDATGLSYVQVNRNLQDLRSMGLITLRKQTLSILNWQKLSEIAEFHPGYLHLIAHA